MGSSNSEAFRDVIDDLTIQNKKLRKKLKKYETLHCSHLQDEKLFEIKFHDLPVHKKRELDDFLRKFALSIEKVAEVPTVSSSRQPSTSLPDPLPLPSFKKPSSSTTSNSKPVDSAYASMSNSEQTQNSYSHLPDKGTTKKPVPTAQSKQENVKSYLDDMPRGLMPKHSLVMSERSKRKLVVRRLEEIFTGKGAASSEHGQSHQQQEVSQSAAKADRNALEEGGRRARVEGLREAQISIFDADVLTEHMSDASLTSRKETNDEDGSTSRNAHASRDGTPDQRPTRPLDLDLYRAQVPADNVQYIRHLGFASPTLKTDPYTNTSNGWVYLNLLMNMAQLHTFNVTPEFVRKSIADLSTKLELSRDGRKIRWKGGSEGSRIRSGSDSNMDEDIGMLLDGVDGGNKRRGFDGSNPNKLGHDIVTDLADVSPCSTAKSSANLRGSTKLRPMFVDQVNNAPKFFYKPLFYHGTSSEEGGDHPGDDGNPIGTVDDDIGAERTSNLQQGGRTISARGTKGENGPIIFYNKARFYTDLSRDPRTGPSSEVIYSRYSPEPVGLTRPKSLYQGILMDDPRGPLTEGHVHGKQVDWDEDSDSATAPLLVYEGFCSRNDELSHAVHRISMDASGLSGVQPTDHFSICVEVQNTKTLEANLRNLPAYMISGMKADRVFAKPSTSPASAKFPLVRSSIVSIDTRQLPPSSLPPPSYIYPQASSENTDNSSNHNELISESHSGKRALPSSTVDDDCQSALPISSLSSFGGTKEESSYKSSSAVESEDSSIDLLAHARELDPETVAAREMEFDRNTRQQLVELPAGSSAATAGGGSGFASEESTVDEEYRPNEASRSSAERKKKSPWTGGSDREDVNAMFTSSGMEESD